MGGGKGSCSQWEGGGVYVVMWSVGRGHDVMWGGGACFEGRGDTMHKVDFRYYLRLNQFCVQTSLMLF